MADVEDVGNALIEVMLPCVYPTGIDNDSVIHADISLFMGWPTPSVLDETLKVGQAMISVFPSDLERDVTRGLSGSWQEMSNDGDSGIGLKETKRQQKTFQIIIWAPNPTKRKLISDAIEGVLSDIPRITLADGSVGNMCYARTIYNNDLEKEGLFRRDYFFQIEYATTRKDTFETVQQTSVNLTPM